MEPLQLSCAIVAIGVAAILRGLTGFGFSIAAAPLLSLVLTPGAAIPIVMLLQALSGLAPAWRDFADVDRHAVAILCLSAIPGIVPGILLLDALAADPMRRIIGLAVIASALVLASGMSIGRPAKTRELAVAGGLGGFLQGVAAMPGPPMIVLLLASSLSPARCRATLSFTFLVLAGIATAIAGTTGMIGRAELVSAALLVIPLLAGQHLGAILFHRLDPRRYRRIGVAVIFATGMLALARSFI